MVHPQDKTDLVAFFKPKGSHSGYVSYVFAAGYLLCPILMEYENSGDFTVAARLRFSLRRNAVPWVSSRSCCHDENGERVHLRGNHHLCYASICACT